MKSQSEKKFPIGLGLHFAPYGEMAMVKWLSVSAVKVRVLSGSVVPSMKFELQCNTLRMKIIIVLSDSFKDSSSWIPKHAKKFTMCTLATSFYYIALEYMLLCISIHNRLQPTFVDLAKTWLVGLLLSQPEAVHHN